MNTEHKLQIQEMNKRITECVENLKVHINDEKNHIFSVEEDVKAMKEKHLVHIQVAVERIATNQDWLMKFFWIVATAAVGGLIAGILNLLK